MGEEREAYGRDELEDIFEELLPLYREVVGKALGDREEGVLSGAREGFADLIPDIPFLGNLLFPLPRTLVESAVALSFYRALKGAGLTTEAAGQLIVEAAEAGFRALPPEELRAQGEQQFTGDWINMQGYAAAESQKRRYPGDWVFEYVEGVPGEFDWGWDFIECGICKFYESQGAPELVPYQCALDFILSRYQDTGLERTTTLAEGAGRCDFRFKQGREVP
jgi:hypothetical protein